MTEAKVSKFHVLRLTIFPPRHRIQYKMMLSATAENASPQFPREIFGRDRYGGGRGEEEEEEEMKTSYVFVGGAFPFPPPASFFASSNQGGNSPKNMRVIMRHLAYLKSVTQMT